MKKRYLGIAATVHDPAIAILDEQGFLLHAEALERPMQFKIAWDICPTALFDYLNKLILRFHSDNCHWSIAISWDFSAKKALKGVEPQQAKLPSAAPNRHGIPDVRWGQWLLKMQHHYLGRLKDTLPFMVSSITGQANVGLTEFDHHLTHAANACYFYEGKEPAVCLVVDGEGEVGALSCFVLKQGQLRRLSRSWGPGSLGGFYGTVTNLIGFDLRKGEEWKLMGLAAYGEFDQVIYDDLSQLVVCEQGKLLPVALGLHQRILDKYIQEIDNFKASPMLAKDIAHTAQLIFEETMIHLLEFYQQKTSYNTLILGGGCALNSKFNGMVTSATGFTTLFVPPAPGDDGNAVGAAALLYNADNETSCLQMGCFVSPYQGSVMNRTMLLRFLQQCDRYRVGDLGGAVFSETAQRLKEGKLVAWVQGRSEFGPRALGNRSILANPAISNIKDIINQQVKYREEYRPFAPAILHEYGQQWFENYQSSPYMEKTLYWRADKIQLVPGVVHRDGTGRVQSVTPDNNRSFYQLLKAFHGLTDIPVLLNTSLNIMGKPIVHSVEDVIGIFFTSGLDVLVIDSFMIEK